MKILRNRSQGGPPQAKRGVGERSEQEASPESRYRRKCNDCDVASCASGTQPALRLGWATPVNGYNSSEYQFLFRIA